jgi:WD40 repeat protein
LASDIQRHLANEPVVARPPSAGYRFQKAVRRHKLTFAASGAVALALALGIVASTWQAVRATRLRHVAEKAQASARGEARRADQNAATAARRAHEADEAREKEAHLRHEAQVQAYAADMSLVQQALALNNLSRAGDLLQRHRRKPGEPDLRGWEWRYLWQQCQSDPHFTLSKTEHGRLRSLAVSRDGKWLAVAGPDGPGVGKVTLWDLWTRKEIQPLSAGNGLVQVAFSPSEPLLAFSVDATDVATTVRSYSVRFWDGAARKRLALELPLDTQCGRLNFSADGQTLVTCTRGEVSLWRVRDGEKLFSYSAAHVNSEENGAAFAAAGDLSVAAYATKPDATIHVIDLATRQERWSKPAAEEEVLALAISPDGRILASGAGYAESAIRLWDVATGNELRQLEGHHSFVMALVFWPDGKTLASASGDQTIRLWDVSDVTHPRVLNVLRGHRDEVWGLALLPGNETLVSYGKDGSVLLWEIALQKRQPTEVQLPEKFAAWRFGQDGKSVLTLGQQRQVAQWSGEDFLSKEPSIEIGMSLVRSKSNWGHWPALFSQDGRWLAVGSTNGLLEVWDLLNRRLFRHFNHATEEAFPWAFLADGKRLVASQPNDFLHEWDLTTGEEISSWPGAGNMTSLAFSPDEQWCLMFSPGVLREMATGHETSLGNPTTVWAAFSATFSLDGKIIAAAGSDGSGLLWDMATRRELKPVGGLLNGLQSVTFSPDGKRLATGSAGREAIKLWNVETLEELLTLPCNGSMFGSTAFSPDGNILGSMNYQGVLHLWRAPSWEEIKQAEAAGAH